MPTTATVGTLLSRATRAGAQGPEAFADWLILDAEWFGPVQGLDRRSYAARRRLALRIYDADPDLVVGSDPAVGLPEPPRPVPPQTVAPKTVARRTVAPQTGGSTPAPAARPVDRSAKETDSALRACVIMLAVLLLIALTAAAGALTGPA